MFSLVIQMIEEDYARLIRSIHPNNGREVALASRSNLVVQVVQSAQECDLLPSERNCLLALAKVESRTQLIAEWVDQERRSCASSDWYRTSLRDV